MSRKPTIYETSDQKIAYYWNEGYQAFLEGAERVHCPYDEGTEEYMNWMAGFDCAEGEAL